MQISCLLVCSQLKSKANSTHHVYPHGQVSNKGCRGKKDCPPVPSPCAQPTMLRLVLIDHRMFLTRIGLTLARSRGRTRVAIRRSISSVVLDSAHGGGETLEEARCSRDLTHCHPAVVKVTGFTPAPLTFQTTWLRHSCPCAACVDAGTGQLTVPLASLSGPCAVQLANVTTSNALRVVWAADGHVSEYPLPRLVAALQPPTPAALPPARTHMASVDFASVLDTDEGLWTWLDGLHRHGTVLVTNGPTTRDSVCALADRISSVQSTVYGKIFEVVAEPKPVNLAYSNIELAVHQDLSAYESPPGLQLLHCILFDEAVEGGWSTMADGFALCEALRRENPAAFHALTRIPATFHKVHYQRTLPVHMTYTRPHISVNRRGEIINFAWAPPFSKPLRPDSALVAHEYYTAVAALVALIEPFTLRFRLQPGQVLTFNNRRCLHGRDAFGTGGARHLQGVYVNVDEFKSRHRVLKTRFAPEAPSFHVGNMDEHAAA